MTELAKVANDYIVRERSDYQLNHFTIDQHNIIKKKHIKYYFKHIKIQGINKLKKLNIFTINPISCYNYLR
jgi:hypothetical protein